MVQVKLLCECHIVALYIQSIFVHVIDYTFLKGVVNSKILTLMLFQTCVVFFLLWDTNGVQIMVL